MEGGGFTYIKPQGEYANFLEQHYVILPTLSTLFNLHKCGIYTCLLCDDNVNFVYKDFEYYPVCITYSNQCFPQAAFCLCMSDIR